MEDDILGLPFLEEQPLLASACQGEATRPNRSLTELFAVVEEACTCLMVPLGP